MTVWWHFLLKRMNFRWKKTIASPKLLAVVVVSAGLLGSTLALQFTNPYTLVLGPFLTVGGVLGYYARGSVAGNRHFGVPTWPVGVGYVLTVGAVASLYVAAGFSRTLPVHVGVLVLYLLVLGATFTVPLESTVWLLPVVLVTGLIHRGLLYYSSATQIGIDAVFHTNRAASIAQQGTLEPLAMSKYWFAPLFHTMTAAVSTLFVIPVRDAAFLTVTFSVTVVPPLVVYLFTESIWNRRIGVLGSLLYVVSDRAINSSVHVATTSLGLVFFSLLLFLAAQYLWKDDRTYYVVLAVFLGGLLATHQLSMFITTIGVTVYALAFTIWRGRLSWKALAVVATFWTAGVVQGEVTRYSGASSDRSIVEVLLTNFGNAIGGLIGSSGAGGGRAASAIPASAEFIRGGVNAVAPVHALGVAFLFGLGVVGAIYWAEQKAEAELWQCVSLGAVVTVMSLLVFTLPLVGIGLLLPFRWFPFMYLPLSILAAPGLLSVGLVVKEKVIGPSRTASTLSTRRGVRGVLLVLVVGSLFATYAAPMMWNRTGSIDGPVFDESPQAHRLSTTTTEVAAYRYALGANPQTTVVADRIASVTIGVGFGYPVRVYSIKYGSETPSIDPPVLLIDREYVHTNHASFSVFYEGRWRTVFGPLPLTRDELTTRYSLVYAGGPERVFYVTEWTNEGNDPDPDN